MNKLRATLLVFSFLLAVPASLLAQNTTSTVLGTVKDPQEGVVVGAQVKLEAKAINVSLTQTTNALGQYTFINVTPGSYTVSVTMRGFRTATVSDFRVEVAKSHTIDVKLELGQVSETVTVESGDVVKQLQTTDAIIGNVITGHLLTRMPALTRRANELVALQPLAVDGGQVAGARNDQSTFTLDGIDITNNSIGGGATNDTLIPLPIDSIEEFGVGVANPTANFGRGAGGQAQILSKGGTNAYHGVAFWYHQNDNLNANTWTLNHTHSRAPDGSIRTFTPKTEQKDNRFGGAFGGPIPYVPYLKGKTFFFANYEGRRFPRTQPFTRVVALDSLRQGQLRFEDCSNGFSGTGACLGGVVRTYNLAGFDPRGLGLSSTILAQLNLLPAGNTTLGDGNNTTGFRGDVPTSLRNDNYILRLDHNITNNWRANVHFRYFRQMALGIALLDISGLSGAEVVSRDAAPQRANFLSSNLQGIMTPNLSAAFQFGWVRTRTATERFRPDAAAAFLDIPGTATGLATGQSHFALDIGARGGADSVLSEPIDYDTQRARKQANDNRLFQWNADFSWIRSTHNFKFGTHVRYLPTKHLRDDKVIGALGALVASIDADGSIVSLPSSVRPPTCAPASGGNPAITTNCIKSSEVTAWNRLFAGMTGLVDGVSVLAVWDGDFNPLPFGSLLEADTRLWAPEFYFEDTWRLKSSFTFTYGVNYGWQQAPTERLGRQSFHIDSVTGEFFNATTFLERRANAARTGQIYNPNFAFLPVDSATRGGIFNVDWNNIAPRFAAAWKPSFKNGVLGKLFGQGRTVFRGGYALIYDRQNTVQSVIVPTLGIAFAQTLTLSAPQCNATGAGGTSCSPGNANPALGSFRVGVDGNIPIPTVPGRSVPVQPFWGITPGCALNSGGTPGVTGLFPSSCLREFPETFSFQVDPDIEVGKNHAVNLTWQRELPWNMLAEVGYVGRFARQLPQSMNLGHAPYTQLDSASGVTFAQAYDSVANFLRSGGNAALIGPPALCPGATPTDPPVVCTGEATTGRFNPPELAWFLNSVPQDACAQTVAGAPRYVHCGRWLAATSGSNFISGNISSLFLAIDRVRLRDGLPSFTNLMSQMFFLRSSTGISNYNAVFATVHKRMARGLLMTANYTFARSLDVGSANQNAASVMANNFDLRSDYGRSDFDFNHVFNATWLYELPFGRGKWIGTSNSILDRFIGGWSVSGIFTSSSGQPLTFTQGSQAWGGALQLGFNSGMVPTASPDSFGNNNIHSDVAGSGGVGTTGNPGSCAGRPEPCTPGTGLSLFGDPASVFNSFRRIEPSHDGRAGRNVLTGFPRWNVDLSIAKTTRIHEQVNFRFAFDFFNAFNHVDFANPALTVGAPTSFGVVTSQFTPTNRTNGARWIQFGARIEF